MKTVIRIGNRFKQTYEIELEQISGMETDAKVILGFVETATEFVTVCAEFLRGLMDRGLSINKGLLEELQSAAKVGGHHITGHRIRAEKNPGVPSASVARRTPGGAELGLELRIETCVAHHGCLVNFN